MLYLPSLHNVANVRLQSPMCVFGDSVSSVGLSIYRLLSANEKNPTQSAHFLLFAENSASSCLSLLFLFTTLPIVAPSWALL